MGMSPIPILGDPGDPSPVSPSPRRWTDVPWRTIVASVAMVIAGVVCVEIILLTARIIVWIVIAGFFAVVLAPAVNRVEARVGHRRATATAIVVMTTTLLVIGTLTLVAWPVRQQAISAATDLPGTIDDAASGDGPVGKVIVRLHLQSYVQDHRADIQAWADDLRGSSVSIARRVLDMVYAMVTVLVLTFLFLTQSASIGRTALALVPERRRPAARLAAADAGRAISGYMIGNLLISVVAGVAALACLLVLGVANAVVLALVVAIADLIPLVGATLGAALASLAAFLHDSTAGFVAIAFFIVYQQIENYVISPMVMSRTVKINPLVVILSVLIGVELFGFTGALLAVPFAGAVQVGIIAARHEHYRDQLRVEGTN